MMTIVSRAAAAAALSLLLAGTAFAQAPAPAASPAPAATPAPAKTGKARSPESLECSKQADEKGLKGKERKKFRKDCIKEAKGAAPKQ
jgi:invasion protein IalB